MSRQDVAADQVWSVEQHGIEPIPERDRHGAPTELFGLWIGANIHFVVLLTGALAMTQGLTVWQGISAILVGNVLGCTVQGFASILGPRTGTAGVAASRTSFGQLGAFAPTALSTISALGWFSINSVVATQCTEQLLQLIHFSAGFGLMWTSMAIVLIAEILLAIYGHATIVAAEKYVSLLLLLLFAGLFVLLLPRIHLDDAGSVARSQPAHWWLAMGLVFSYAVSWTNFASDYSRYLPSNTRWKSVVLYAGSGSFVGNVFCELVGVAYALAVGGHLSEPVTQLLQLLPPWYFVPFLLAVIFGSIAANVPNGYTASLGLLALRIPISRTGSILVIAVATIVFRIATLVFGHFIDLYQQWLGYMEFWVCPWTAIVVVDYFLRKGNYDSNELMGWRGRYWYSAGINVVGLASFAVGIAATFLFSNSETYVSPLMIRLGAPDFGFEAGLIVSAAFYYVGVRAAKGTLGLAASGLDEAR
jgi:nucleobase:cation symporter-1, NCS1 family